MTTPRHRLFSLIAGPVGAWLIYLWLPDHFASGAGDLVSLDHPAKATLAMMVWMAVWWLTEAIDIRVTALLPVVLFPLFGVGSIHQAVAPYAAPIIFLMLGGFLIATAIQRWGLDRRIALGIVSRVGSSPARIVGGFMLATAFLSAFISNTATTAMMLPIGMSVIGLVLYNGNSAEHEPREHAFATCIMLSIAYAASIGGISTVIGTVPNSFAVSFIRDAIDAPYQQDISFFEWSRITVPVVLVLLPLSWWLLTKVVYKVNSIRLAGSAAALKEQNRALGAMDYEERAVLVVFAVTVALWLTRGSLQQIELSLFGQVVAPLAGLTDAGIAIFAAVLMFIIPAKNHTGQFILQWVDLKNLPWGILFLLGGGLSLAAAVKANGVTEFIGAQALGLSFLPVFLILLVVISGVVFLTELTSNTATTATLVPILAAIAPALGIHPYTLVIPAAIAASCAFMLPIATPPNAIVFGSGYITSQQMRKTGIWLNLICLTVITLAAAALSDFMIALVNG